MKSGKSGGSQSSSSNKQSHSSGTPGGPGKRGKQDNGGQEDAFLKLFQDHGVNLAKHGSPSHAHGSSHSPATPADEFTRWCYESVTVIGGGSVDVPTFISFLKEVESPFEVNDYIRYVRPKKTYDSSQLLDFVR